MMVMWKKEFWALALTLLLGLLLLARSGAFSQTPKDTLKDSVKIEKA